MAKFQSYKFTLVKLLKVYTKRLKTHITKKQRKAFEVLSLEDKLTCLLQEPVLNAAIRHDAVGLSVELDHLLDPEPAGVFVESSDLMNKLSTSKFSAKGIKISSFPLKKFILLVPQGSRIQQFEMPSVLIAITTQKERQANMKRLSEMCGIKMQYADTNQDMCINIMYKCKQGEEGIHVANIKEDMIGAVLAAKTYQQYNSTMGCLSKMTDNSIYFPLDDEDLELQFYLVRMILQMMIYIIAKPDKLKEGFLMKADVKLPSKMKGYDLHSSTFTNNERSSPEQHFRSPHFAVLTHSKYYQGEHKNKVVGSRVIFKEGSWVNPQKEVAAHTIVS